MAGDKNKNFMQHDGIEIGYFSKRKDQFIKSIEAGLKFATNGKQSIPVKPKRKHRSNTADDTASGKLPVKKDVNRDKPAAKGKKDLVNTPPNQLSGKDFVERMRLAREAKAKQKGDNA